MAPKYTGPTKCKTKTKNAFVNAISASQLCNTSLNLEIRSNHTKTFGVKAGNVADKASINFENEKKSAEDKKNRLEKLIWKSPFKRAKATP